jgi:hypothetical protein
MLVRTRDGDRFGAFANDGFAGAGAERAPNAEAFVFAFAPALAAYRWARSGAFVLAVSAEEITVSGAGAAAIWIDDQRLNGFSERCEAFDSPPLASKPQFQVAELEFWRLGA